MADNRESNYSQGTIPMKVIAHIRTDFPSKFGVPRQSGLVNALRGTIIFEAEYRNIDALRGLEDFSHIWLVWQFSKVVGDGFSPTVRPPRYGGNKRMGVFATRSPFRPNPIGLSSVKLDRIELDSVHGPVLHISGVDLVDKTPILDIKPYLPYTDCHIDARGGYTDYLNDNIIEVEFSEELLQLIPDDKQSALIGALAHDPRPSYQKDSDRIYGMQFGEFDIRFTVKNKILIVREVVPLY
ncbi:tRNA (N6-threonylcarbamoyladenosine(37)-N6)-methyltransferase TrmO [Tissierella sp.]|uniref:tRNA (N6-threonylcarbamoyladenosine(37)-N6)-methyltransferase TrmO n=1 Tax=Tissierella sp. TaxID=41274 RepID=UPI00285C455B|nr:tRNA (N6-threonylcarbamoyladenosine(37)-N6)-methyltransferase TrmO [Tissierella sp.]MDR7855560.1 tRNA (N6-threonylcarbamoyladenosine(37)-N6)-methyltransferase TrmO [Tissierella sp.]